MILRTGKNASLNGDTIQTKFLSLLVNPVQKKNQHPTVLIGFEAFEKKSVKNETV